MLQNPAMEEFLAELDVVPTEFKIPGRMSVMRRVDEFLENEDKAERAAAVNQMDYFGLSWDEWTSKQNLCYISVNITGIPYDFSRLVNFMVAVSKFPFPHKMRDIRLKVLGLTRRVLRELEDAEVTEDGELLTGFLSKVSSITYDGASANYAFSPSSTARGLTFREKEERRAVNEKYKEVDEMRCLCHRIVKVLEHSYDDSGNEAIAIYSRL